METKTKQPDTSKLKEEIIERIEKAQAELEELRVQLALGKADALEKYDEARKKLNHYLAEVKVQLDKGSEAVSGKWDALRTRLAELKDKLEDTRTASRENFDRQKEKLDNTLESLAKAIREVPVTETTARLKDEVEKFKVKTEILRVRLHLGKLEAEETMQAQKKKLTTKMSEVRASFQNKKEDFTGKWDAFSDEMEQAYAHIKQAFAR
ncbi:MAG: hypothetical protein H6585_10280 [Flavobacteriales bacterium]|nr:hypothetical protein [Flavobacteriales bacterium]MCB9448718.1 hypothetical protein [Flavobacteriales bacterium]